MFQFPPISLKISNCNIRPNNHNKSKQYSLSRILLYETLSKKNIVAFPVDDVICLSLSLSDVFLETVPHIIAVSLFCTFEGLSRLEQQRSLCKLIIRTCVCCAVLCAIIHLGESGAHREGRRVETRAKGEPSEDKTERNGK